MKKLMFAIVVSLAAACAVARDGSVAEQLKTRLMSVGDSPQYYWAWTYPWLNHGGWIGDMRNVVEKDGVFLPNPAETVTHMTAVDKMSMINEDM